MIRLLISFPEKVQEMVFVSPYNQIKIIPIIRRVLSSDPNTGQIFPTSIVKVLLKDRHPDLFIPGEKVMDM